MMDANKKRKPKGQTLTAHLKYREAIEACDNIEHIGLNISQIARMFGLDGTALANQLRRHYPEILPRREKERQHRGIADNIHRGARKYCLEAYSDAIELLWNSTMTIEEAADACGVTYRGLKEHICCYHKDLDSFREKKRRRAGASEKVRGERTGSWRKHLPEADTEERYKEAVGLYCTTSMDLLSITEQVGCSYGGLRHYLKEWYPELIVERRGFARNTRLGETKRYRKSSAEKYAEPIRVLKETDRPIASVASEFGFNPNVFMQYVKEHEPELASLRGRTLMLNGRRVSNSGYAKYAEAIRLYETTLEPLKSIAWRLGLTYNSLSGFIRRNCPDVIEKHKTLMLNKKKD